MRNYKSKKAIKVLNNYLSELDHITNAQQGNNWKATLKDTLILYVGKDSSTIKRLESLYFTKKITSTSPMVLGGFVEHVFIEEHKEHFKDLIQNTIKYIESNGLFKNTSSSNFLSKFKTVEIISGLFIASGVLFSIGRYVGKQENERDVINTNSKIETVEKKYHETILINEKLRNELKFQVSKPIPVKQKK
jgi:hypothetical protein